MPSVTQLEPGIKGLMIIEDDSFFSECLKDLFLPFGTEVYQYYTVSHFLNNGLALLNHTDVVLLDINLGMDSGLDLINTIKQHKQSVCIIMITSVSDQYSVKKAFSSGVSGYLLKAEKLAEIYDQIMTCYKGNRVAISNNALSKLFENDTNKFLKNSHAHLFTEREQEVILLLQRGLTQKEIGYSMSISASTVNQHLKHIYNKMNVRSKTELIYKLSN
ncbi:MAG: DNA-binding response regulator, LuxR family [Chitinophagaceae bacterium]|nr:DNA-binding response regulator, LuxR family [Chitinophagaceae bacterium]